MAVQEKLLTVEELMTLPRDGVKRELDHGTVVERRFGPILDMRVGVRIAVAIQDYITDSRSGTLFIAARHVLHRNPDIVRIPDLGFSATPQLLEGDERFCVMTPPDLAIEVIAPEDLADNVNLRVMEYLRAGTRIVWNVYRKLELVYAFSSQTHCQALRIGDSLDGGDVLPNFKLPLKQVFEGLGD